MVVRCPLDRSRRALGVCSFTGIGAGVDHALHDGDDGFRPVGAKAEAEVARGRRRPRVAAPEPTLSRASVGAPLRKSGDRREADLVADAAVGCLGRRRGFWPFREARRRSRHRDRQAAAPRPFRVRDRRRLRAARRTRPRQPGSLRRGRLSVYRPSRHDHRYAGAGT